MINLSAPSKSGYKGQFESIEDAQQKAAALLDVAVEDMVTVESPDGSTTYCYPTAEDAEADLDGAYAVQYSDAE